MFNPFKSLLAGDYGMFFPPGTSAKREGAKRAAARIIAHKKQWANTPKGDGVSRQVMRRMMRQAAKLEQQQGRKALLRAKKIANGIA